MGRQSVGFVGLLIATCSLSSAAHNNLWWCWSQQGHILGENGTQLKASHSNCKEAAAEHVESQTRIVNICAIFIAGTTENQNTCALNCITQVARVARLTIMIATFGRHCIRKLLIELRNLCLVCNTITCTHPKNGLSFSIPVLVLPNSIAWHGTALHGTAWHSTAQHSTAQHSTAQHSTAQHSTAQHSTAQHSTAQHSTAQHSIAWHSVA